MEREPTIHELNMQQKRLAETGEGAIPGVSPGIAVRQAEIEAIVPKKPAAKKAAVKKSRS